MIKKADDIILKQRFGQGREFAFKRACLNYWRDTYPGRSFYCIESPMTVPGFPDVVELRTSGTFRLIEFKCSDLKGTIHFEKAQLLFYRKNRDMRITILAYNVRDKVAVYIDPAIIVKEKKLSYRIPVLAEAA